MRVGVRTVLHRAGAGAGGDGAAAGIAQAVMVGLVAGEAGG